jgi:hypothetical protein
MGIRRCSISAAGFMILEAKGTASSLKLRNENGQQD